MLPAIVISASYRLIPEHQYPTQYEDGFNILKFLDDKKNRMMLPQNADMHRCFVLGDCVGGNIVHHVCIGASQHNFQQFKVIGLLALQPLFEGEEHVTSEISCENRLGLQLDQMDFYWNVIQPITPDEKWDRDNGAINISGPKALDISALSFPPTLVVVGGRDILEDRQRNYYVWLKNSGKEAYLEQYEYLLHGIYTFPQLAESTHVISLVKNFINEQMKFKLKLKLHLHSSL